MEGMRKLSQKRLQQLATAMTGARRLEVAPEIGGEIGYVSDRKVEPYLEG